MSTEGHALPIALLPAPLLIDASPAGVASRWLLNPVVPVAFKGRDCRWAGVGV